MYKTYKDRHRNYQKQSTALNLSTMAQIILKSPLPVEPWSKQFVQTKDTQMSQCYPSSLRC